MFKKQTVMKNKKFVGQLISVRFKDRETPIYGYVVDYNKDWTLMKYNPVDYVIDGYLIFRHKNVKGLRRGVDEKWKEKVMNLKGLAPTDKDLIPLTDLETILKYLTENFGVFQVYTKSESASYLGRLDSISDKEVVLDDLNPKGEWDGQLSFKPDKIRVIEFDNDYTNSLKLVAATIPQKPECA